MFFRSLNFNLMDLAVTEIERICQILTIFKTFSANVDLTINFQVSTNFEFIQKLEIKTLRHSTTYFI